MTLWAVTGLQGLGGALSERSRLPLALATLEELGSVSRDSCHSAPGLLVFQENPETQICM